MDSEKQMLYTCIGTVAHMISLSQAWVLYRVFNHLNKVFNLVRVEGLSSIIIYTEEKEKHIIGTLYGVDINGYNVYESREIGSKAYKSRISDKVFLVKYDDLSKYIRKSDLNILKQYGSSIIDTILECRGRNEYECVLSTDKRLAYGLTYLALTLKCREEALEITAIEFFDKLIETLREPLSRLILELIRRKKLDTKIYETYMDALDEGILIFYSNLISRHKLVLPNIIDVKDFVNYVHSHYGW